MCKLSPPAPAAPAVLTTRARTIFATVISTPELRSVRAYTKQSPGYHTHMTSPYFNLNLPSPQHQSFTSSNCNEGNIGSWESGSSGQEVWVKSNLYLAEFGPIGHSPTQVHYSSWWWVCHSWEEEEGGGALLQQVVGHCLWGGKGGTGRSPLHRALSICQGSDVIVIVIVWLVKASFACVYVPVVSETAFLLSLQLDWPPMALSSVL